jgi:glycerophosphoryl diester phosphodiesterase
VFLKSVLFRARFGRLKTKRRDFASLRKFLRPSAQRVVLLPQARPAVLRGKSVVSQSNERYTPRMLATPWNYPKTIAHRGAGKLAPENTLAAIRYGVSLGYRATEIDVKLSADGVSVLMHDDTCERTTNGFGWVRDKTLRELSQLDAGARHSAPFVGEPIPTYANVLAYCIANGVALNTEIKPSTGTEPDTGASVAIETRSLLAHYKVPNTMSPLLSSFSTEALMAARDAAAELPRAHLFENPLPADWLAKCKAVDATALDANWRTLTADIVKTAHDNGLYVACYTCNDLEIAEKLWRWGVNSVITDAVDVIAFRG